MTASVPSDLPRWRKSTHSVEANCIELAPLQDDTIAMRDSKHPQDDFLTFQRRAFDALLKGAKAGEFDDMV